MTSYLSFKNTLANIEATLD